MNKYFTASIFGLFASAGLPTVAILRFEQTYEDEGSVFAAATVQAKQAEYEGRNYDAILIVKSDQTMLVLNPIELIAQSEFLKPLNNL